MPQVRIGTIRATAAVDGMIYLRLPLEVLLLDVSARLEDAVQREDHVNIFSSVDDLLGRERAPQPPAMIKLGSLGT